MKSTEYARRGVRQFMQHFWNRTQDSLSNTCNFFYIGKSQRYVKTRIQEHIGEVTKLYAKNILATNHRSQTTTPPPHPSQTQSEARSTSSLKTQQETSSLDSFEGTLPISVVINNTATTAPPNRHRHAPTKLNATRCRLHRRHHSRGTIPNYDIRISNKHQPNGRGRNSHTPTDHQAPRCVLAFFYFKYILSLFIQGQRHATQTCKDCLLPTSTFGSPQSMSSAKPVSQHRTTNSPRS